MSPRVPFYQGFLLVTAPSLTGSLNGHLLNRIICYTCFPFKGAVLQDSDDMAWMDKAKLHVEGEFWQFLNVSCISFGFLFFESIAKMCAPLYIIETTLLPMSLRLLVTFKHIFVLNVRGHWQLYEKFLRGYWQLFGKRTYLSQGDPVPFDHLPEGIDYLWSTYQMMLNNLNRLWQEGCPINEQRGNFCLIPVKSIKCKFKMQKATGSFQSHRSCMSNFTLSINFIYTLSKSWETVHLTGIPPLQGYIPVLNGVLSSYQGPLFYTVTFLTCFPPSLHFLTWHSLLCMILVLRGLSSLNMYVPS
jgi:hypothetical protein